MDIIKGTIYIGTVTGTLNGVRVYRELQFVAARTQTPEPFIRSGKSPDQDRVFVEHNEFGSAPALFITGSIKEII
jgi:hypothetical protein